MDILLMVPDPVLLIMVVQWMYPLYRLLFHRKWSLNQNQNQNQKQFNLYSPYRQHFPVTFLEVHALCTLMAVITVSVMTVSKLRVPRDHVTSTITNLVIAYNAKMDLNYAVDGVLPYHQNVRDWITADFIMDPVVPASATKMMVFQAVDYVIWKVIWNVLYVTVDMNSIVIINVFPNPHQRSSALRM